MGSLFYMNVSMGVGKEFEVGSRGAYLVLRDDSQEVIDFVFYDGV